MSDAVVREKALQRDLRDTRESLNRSREEITELRAEVAGLRAEPPSSRSRSGRAPAAAADVAVVQLAHPDPPGRVRAPGAAWTAVHERRRPAPLARRPPGPLARSRVLWAAFAVLSVAAGIVAGALHVARAVGREGSGAGLLLGMADLGGPAGS